MARHHTHVPEARYGKCMGQKGQPLYCPSCSRAAQATLAGPDDRLWERNLNIWAVVLFSCMTGDLPVPLLAQSQTRIHRSMTWRTVGRPVLPDEGLKWGEHQPLTWHGQWTGVQASQLQLWLWQGRPITGFVTEAFLVEKNPWVLPILMERF